MRSSSARAKSGKRSYISEGHGGKMQCINDRTFRLGRRVIDWNIAVSREKSHRVNRKTRRFSRGRSLSAISGHIDGDASDSMRERGCIDEFDGFASCVHR